MSRSLKKGPFIEPKLMKKVEAVKRSNARTGIRTWSRASTLSGRDAVALAGAVALIVVALAAAVVTGAFRVVGT